MSKRLILVLLFTIFTLRLHADMYDEARDEARKQDRYVAAAFSYAVSKFNSDEYDECIKEIDKVIALAKQKLKDTPIKDKFLSYLWSLRGQCNFLLDRYNDTIDDCETSLCFGEHNGWAYFFKGKAYNLLDNQKMARACLKLSAQRGCRQAQEIVLAYDM